MIKADDLYKEITKECMRINQGYLDKIYADIPEIKYAIDGKFVIPPSPPMPPSALDDNKLNEFEKWENEILVDEITELTSPIFEKMNLEDSELYDIIKEGENFEEIKDLNDQMNNLIGELGFLDDYSKTTYPTKKDLENLKNELLNNLDDDGIMSEFLAMRVNNNLETLLRINWITGLNLDYKNYTKPIFIHSGKIKIPWSIVSFCYLRDFELYDKYIIKPILKGMGLKGQTYADRIEAFIDKVNNPIIYSEITEILNPDIRNRIVHLLYYFDTKRDVIVFIPDKIYSTKNEKIERNFVEMIQLAKNMNHLLWTTLKIIFVQSKTNNPFSIFLPKIKPFKIEKSLLKINSISQHYQFSLTYLEEYREKVPKHLVDFPAPIIEAFEMYMLFHFGNIPKLDGINLNQYSHYLVSYTLIEERFLKPLAKAIDSSINLGKVKDTKLLEIINNYKNGKYKILFQNFEPSKRNSLAHFDYFAGSDYIYYDDWKTHSFEKFILNGLKNLTYFRKLENLFTGKGEIVFLYIGIANLIARLGKENKTWDNSLHETAVRILSEQFPELKTLINMSTIAHAFHNENIREVILKGLRQQKPDDLHILWNYAFFYSKKNKNLVSWMTDFEQNFGLKPTKKIYGNQIWKIMGYVYIIVNDQKRANEAFKRAKL